MGVILSSNTLRKWFPQKRTKSVVSVCIVFTWACKSGVNFGNFAENGIRAGKNGDFCFLFSEKFEQEGIATCKDS